MTENHERAEQARFVFHIYGCNVQIVPNATHAIQIIHQGDGIGSLSLSRGGVADGKLYYARRFGTPRVTGAAVGKS